MRSINKLIIFGLNTFLIFSLFVLNSCGGSRVSLKSLPENDRKFLEEVSLIITKHEKRRFISLTNSADRESFKNEFWSKRDPDPQTDENEFRIEYFNRMEFANKFFKYGKKKGWKTDRGRIYMILGPPTTRRFYQGRIYTQIGKKPLDAYPHIIWLYGDFPVVFVDNNYSNDFRLTSISARQIGMLNVVGIMLKPKVIKEKFPMSFEVDLRKNRSGNTDIVIFIPLSSISFSPDTKNLSHSTTIHLTLKLFNRGTKKTEIKKRDYKINLTEAELEKMTKNYRIKYPLSLKKGKYTLEIFLKNSTDGKETKRKIKFAIKK